jgi:hypothetical protein
MKLNKIKFDRVAEEVDRGFNIITNGELPPGLSNLENTKYMKPHVGVWEKMGHQPDQSKPASNHSAKENTFEISGYDVKTRSRRYAQLSPTHAAAVAPTSLAPASHAASLPSKSNASAHPASHASSKPASHASMKPPSHAAASETSSKRAIRTGAF